MKFGFDLDGTIITCENKQCALMERIVSGKSINITFDVSTFWDDKRNGFNNFDSLLRQGIPEGIIKEICNEWLTKIETLESITNDELFIGATGILKNIVNIQGKIPVITARNNEEVLNQQVELLGLTEYCDIYPVKHSSVIGSKAKLLKNLNIDVFVGDTESDFKAALSANVDFIGVASGQRSKSFLQKHGVTTIINNISELIL